METDLKRLIEELESIDELLKPRLFVPHIVVPTYCAVYPPLDDADYFCFGWTRAFIPRLEGTQLKELVIPPGVLYRTVMFLVPAEQSLLSLLPAKEVMTAGKRRDDPIRLIACFKRQGGDFAVEEASKRLEVAVPFTSVFADQREPQARRCKPSQISPLLSKVPSLPPEITLHYYA